MSPQNEIQPVRSLVEFVWRFAAPRVADEDISDKSVPTTPPRSVTCRGQTVLLWQSLFAPVQ